MPKPSKQSKPDHSQGLTEDCADSSEASASSDLALSHESPSPELSHGALLKHIAEVVAEEGRRTQKMLNDSFVKLESGLDSKVDSTNEVAAVTDSLATRQAETETRISALEDDISPLKGKQAALEKLNTALTEKVTDLEGRSWRDNIRILNLKESVEGNFSTFFLNFHPKTA